VSGLQIWRVGVVGFLVAAVQTAAFDRFLLLGLAYLALPLWLAIVVGRRLPWTSAAVAGFGCGLAWDLLALDLFGRYALVLAIVGATSSLVGDRSVAHRMTLLAASNVCLWVVSAMVGETLPMLDGRTLGGLLLSVAVGLLFIGSRGPMARLALPGPTAWDGTGARSSDWVDRRAGLHPVAGAEPVDDEYRAA
jgi:hypothetical protein